jgi:FKBP-type peptidyl-prolyl cis-trans isomerase SlyD
LEVFLFGIFSAFRCFFAKKHRMSITTGATVTLHYTLRADNADGEIIEVTTPEEPMVFVQGQDPLLPQFMAALEGKTTGDKLQVFIASPDAYGDEEESLYVEYPKSTFIVDGELDEDAIEEGEVIPMNTPDGETVYGVVTEVKLNTVVLDFNHPLAGTDLHFDIEIVSVAH